MPNRITAIADGDARVLALHPTLMPAQVPIWREVARGGTIAQIAESQHLSIDGVKSQLKFLYRRLPLATSTRTALALYGLRTQTFILRPLQEKDVFRRVSPSPAEQDVLHLIALGYTNPEIGKRLDRSQFTVKSQFASLAKKCGTGDRTLIAIRAFRCGRVR